MDKKLLTDTALLVLRLTLGAIFVAHGLQKLFGIFGGSGIQGFAGMLAQINFSPSVLWAWIVALGETIGGGFLIAGILPRLSAALIGMIMIVAILMIHGPKGFFAMRGGFEYQLLILAVCVLFVLVGAGRFSVYNKW
ncbi:MAG: DoxX family protein [Candidatus Omnitrophota bacterium]|nr:MAG: DoxX family protein [Candidatus Omnitrophota bacterium]